MIDYEDQGKKYDYAEAVADDIRAWAREPENAETIREIVEYALSDDEAADDLRERLQDEDDVTGNAIGSRFYSTWKARRCFCNGDAINENLQAIDDAGIFTAEECGKMIADGDWEKLDVIRRFVALDSDEVRDAIEEIIAEEAKKQGKEF